MTFTHDLRFAARALRRRPAFAAVVGVTLALGVGVNTAVFSVVNAVLLAPLPFRHADRLVALSEVAPTMNEDLVSPITFADWKERNDVFTDMAAFRYWPNVTIEDVAGGAPAEAILQITASNNLFSVLGIAPLVGRVYGDDGSREGPAEVVISYDLWQRRFSGDREIVGRRVLVHGTPFTIVGIMPPVRGGMLIGWGDAWSPLRRYDIQQQRATGYRGRYLTVVGRVKDGVTMDQARGRMTTLQHQLAREATSVAAGYEVRIESVKTTLVGDMATVLLVVFAAAALAYLAACANVGNLMLARAASREREIAMRLALGASRGRVVSHALAEGVLLAAIGLLLGVLVARVALAFILSTHPEIPRFSGDGIGGGLDATALAFAAGVSIVAMLLASAAPLLGARLRSLQGALREGSRGGTSARRRRVRSTLATAQIALACLLLVSASLLTTSLVRLLRADPGFRASGAVVADFSNPRIWTANDAERVVATRRLLQRISETPGVSAAGMLLYFPYHPKLWQSTAVAEGSPVRSGEERMVYYNLFAGDYFRAMGIPLIAGRPLNATEMWDRADGATIVNRSLAEAVFGSASPIGKRFRSDEGAPWLTVVGVVGDVRQRRLDDAPRAEYYRPFSSMAMPFGTLVVRGATHSGAAQSDVETAHIVARAMREAEPGLAAASVIPLERFVASSETPRRVAMATLLMFAVTTALLAGLGLYGVMSYLVLEDRSAIGVRMALGASSADVIRLYTVRGLRSAAIGTCLGMLTAIALARGLSALLYGVHWTDAATALLAPMSVGLIAIAAASVPAVRASRVSPTVALRG